MSRDQNGKANPVLNVRHAEDGRVNRKKQIWQPGCKLLNNTVNDAFSFRPRAEEMKKKKKRRRRRSAVREEAVYGPACLPFTRLQITLSIND